MSVSHFGNSSNISTFFIIIVFVMVIVIYYGKKYWLTEDLDDS